MRRKASSLEELREDPGWQPVKNWILPMTWMNLKILPQSLHKGMLPCWPLISPLCDPKWRNPAIPHWTHELQKCELRNECSFKLLSWGNMLHSSSKLIQCSRVTFLNLIRFASFCLGSEWFFPLCIIKAIFSFAGNFWKPFKRLTSYVFTGKYICPT